MNKINLLSIKEYLLLHSSLCRRLVYLRDKRSALRDPKAEASRVYKRSFGHDIRWEDPIDLVEKTSWLQFNTDTSLWTRCADKYAVRSYVEECGLSDMLVKLYGKWDKVEDVDFANLPSKFVLKSNNATGTVIVVEDKSQIKEKQIRKKMKEWLKYEWGYYSADLFYTKIKPCLIAEEYLENDKSNISASLIDYKIWCFNGEPESIWVAYDRRPGKPVKMALFDLDWNPMNQHLVSGPHYALDVNDKIERPASLDKMLDACRILAKPFKEVRVDLYDIKGKPYFGELTFTSGYGFYTEDYYNYLGSKIDLSDLK